jgi:DNA-binding transcriptional LysR family regulator
VLAGTMDAALVTGPIVDGPFEREPIYREELVIVASAGHAPITAKGAEPPRSIVAFEQGCPHRARLEQWYAGKNSMPVQTIEITSYHAMLGCVVVGMGISLVPLSVLATFPERARLSVHALPPGSDSAQTELIWRKGAMSPKIRALVEVLKPFA